MKPKKKSAPLTYSIYFGGALFDLKDLIGNTDIPKLCHQFPEKFGQN